MHSYTLPVPGSEPGQAARPLRFRHTGLPRDLDPLNLHTAPSETDTQPAESYAAVYAFIFSSGAEMRLTLQPSFRIPSTCCSEPAQASPQTRFQEPLSFYPLLDSNGQCLPDLCRCCPVDKREQSGLWSWSNTETGSPGDHTFLRGGPCPEGVTTGQSGVLHFYERGQYGPQESHDTPSHKSLNTR